MKTSALKNHKAALRAATLEHRPKTRGRVHRSRKKPGARAERRASKTALRRGEW